MTPTYTRTAITLHWLLAFMILGNLGFGLYMVGLEVSPQKLKFLSWHKWMGVTILTLSAARLAWRLAHPAPPLPDAMPAWQKHAAHASHALLYVFFFAAPLSGWLFSSAAGFQTVYLGVLPIPDLLSKNRELADVLKQVHRSITYALGAVIVVHIAAAWKHHLVDRDDVMTRMLPFLKPRSR